MVVRYSNYKRFGSTIKIGPTIKVEPDQTQPQPQKP
jgi:hypothetical protein